MTLSNLYVGNGAFNPSEYEWEELPRIAVKAAPKKKVVQEEVAAPPPPVVAAPVVKVVKKSSPPSRTVVVKVKKKKVPPPSTPQRVTDEVVLRFAYAGVRKLTSREKYIERER